MAKGTTAAPIPETVVHHVHTHQVEPAARERVEPVRFDPLARYDALYRKQPKRIGFMEVVRAVPALLAQFPGRVPSERWKVLDDDDQAVFDCVCGEIVHAPPNALTDCVGCERSFAFVGSQILVSKTVRANEIDDAELSS